VTVQANTRYDAGRRRQSIRRGRERGCWVYVPAEELERANIDPYGPAPLYSMWGRQRGSLLVRLYKPNPEYGEGGEAT